MTIYVIVHTGGSYDDWFHDNVGYCFSREAAEAAISKLCEKRILEMKTYHAKDKLRWAGYEIFRKNNPEPSLENKPVFDKNKKDDKEYCKQHQRNVSIWESTVHKEYLKENISYSIKRETFILDYIEENFQPEMVYSIILKEHELKFEYVIEELEELKDV